MAACGSEGAIVYETKLGASSKALARPKPKVGGKKSLPSVATPEPIESAPIESEPIEE